MRPEDAAAEVLLIAVPMVAVARDDCFFPVSLFRRVCFGGFSSGETAVVACLPKRIETDWF